MSRPDKITPIILCGGSGTRLWPLSTTHCPKPYLPILVNHMTLLQHSLQRVKADRLFHSPVIVAQAAHEKLVKQQCADMGVTARIILEPESCNTAAAMAMAALLSDMPEETLMLVMPADHYIEDVTAFQAMIAQADVFPDEIMLFGMAPSYAATQYGYMQQGRAAGHQRFDVESFEEKPDCKRATSYVADGRYFWNSGMFMMSRRTACQAIDAHQPTLWQQAQQAAQSCYQENNTITIMPRAYKEMPSASWDVAVMEHYAPTTMMVCQSDWSDMGSFHSLSHYYQTHASRVQTVRCPWGEFRLWHRWDGVQIKELVIYPCARLSLQSHQERSEFWMVIEGHARVVKGSEVLELEAGQSVYVPQLMKHRLENIGQEPLRILEIQQGDYLGEDDIIRYEDDFGRECDIQLSNCLK